MTSILGQAIMVLIGKIHHLRLNKMIKTQRLDLIPLSSAQLHLYLDDPAQLEAELGLRVSRPLITDVVKRAISMKLEKMAKTDPAQLDWYTYWLIVLRDLPFGAGLIGFKGIPNEQGEAEIGYGIDPLHQGKGVASEAAQAMIHWAFQNANCRWVTALKVLRTNYASQHVLQKCDMVLYAEDGETLSFRVANSRKS